VLRFAQPLLHIGLSAALWVCVYYLNGWLFAALESTRTANWVFLPAAVRLLVVLLFGGWGALGLGVGTLITNGPIFGWMTLPSAAVATLSALAPYLAVQAGRVLLRLPATLHGVTGISLLQLGAMSAACSVLMHSVLFYILDSANGINDLVSMLVGDVLGTLLLLYALRTLLVWGERWREKVRGLE
jgi:hypothetical protein